MGCFTDTLEHNPLLGSLFDMGLHNGKPISISKMLHFGMEDGYVDNGTEIVNGIPCRRYVSQHVPVPAINGTFEVKYYWTRK